MLGRSNHDLDITIQGVQEPEQPVGREPIELASGQCRHHWLVDAQELCRPTLLAAELGLPEGKPRGLSDFDRELSQFISAGAHPEEWL